MSVYSRVKVKVLSLSLSVSLSLCLLPPCFHLTFLQWAWFKCSAGRILNNLSDFHVCKCPHMSSHYPGSLPTDQGGFKGPVSVEREAVCVRREQQPEWLLVPSTDAAWFRQLPNTTLVISLLIRTTVWWNLQTFTDFSADMNHRGAFIADEILHHPQHAWLIKLHRESLWWMPSFCYTPPKIWARQVILSMVNVTFFFKVNQDILLFLKPHLSFIPPFQKWRDSALI